MPTYTFIHKEQITAGGNLTVLEILTGVSERPYFLKDSHHPFWDKLMHSITFLVCGPGVLQLFILPLIQQGFKSFCSFPSGCYNSNQWNNSSLVTGTNNWTKIHQFSFQEEIFFFLISDLKFYTEAWHILFHSSDPHIFQCIHWIISHFPANIWNLG